ncbi:MAG: hypothetical protein ACI9B9_001565 [Halioglobus sp.]|jgi:hypothetical protein
MSNQQTLPTNTSSEAGKPSTMHRLGQWIQDPMGSVLFASAATIGSFGVVLSGTWLIGLTLS